MCACMANDFRFALSPALLGCALALLGCGSSDSNDSTTVDASDSALLDSRDDADTVVAPCDGGCAGGSICCEGACIRASSCDFAVTSLSSASGWQNGNDWITLTGSGFAKGMKVFFGDGRAPVLVRSPTSAIVQTPPGTGLVDVRIIEGGAEATLPRAFTYRSGSLKDKWIEKPMGSPRGRAPALAVLQDGHVLIAGGVKGPDGYFPDTATDSAEIFDRPTQSLSPVGSTMSTVRWYSTAITLLDGRVLVVGGACWQVLTPCYGDATRADVYDPATGKFTPTLTPLNRPRVFPRAVLLVDGRVLLNSVNDGTIEIYDPNTNAFTLLTPPVNNGYGFMSRLRDGRVIMGGGNLVAAAQTFDSDKNEFSATGALQIQRYWPTAHTLPDGRVAVIGGSTGSCCGWTPLDSIELYDPSTGKFSVAPYKLTAPRFEQGSALVRDGTILVVGGFTVAGDCSSFVSAVDQIDPVKGTVVPFPAFPRATTEVSVATLLDGSVLVVGGGGCGASPVPFVDFLENDPVPR